MTIQSYEDMLFDRFVADAGRGKTIATQRRYAQVIARLLQFLDQVDVAPHLGTDAAALLEIERDFGRRGAFLRVLDATELVCCLPEFVGAQWLPSESGPARTQISLTGRLLTWMRRHQLIDWSAGACAFYETEAAVRQARESVRPAWRSDA